MRQRQARPPVVPKVWASLLNRMLKQTKLKRKFAGFRLASLNPPFIMHRSRDK
jgi:hypothetical protein